MADQKPKQDGKLNIELDEKVAEGTYSNLAIINLIDSYKAEVEMLRNQVTQIEESES